MGNFLEQQVVEKSIKMDVLIYQWLYGSENFNSPILVA